MVFFTNPTFEEKPDPDQTFEKNRNRRREKKNNRDEKITRDVLEQEKWREKTDEERSDQEYKKKLGNYIRYLYIIVSRGKYYIWGTYIET